MAYAEPEGMDEEELAKANEEYLSGTGQTRAEAAVALKVAGATYSQIARALEYNSVHQARVAVERALAATVGDDDRMQQRFINGRRLERLLRSMWGKATDEKNPEHLAAARTALAIIDRHIRLYGSDAPAQMVVHSPTQVEFNQVLSLIASRVVNDTPQELDILDVEEEDDD